MLVLEHRLVVLGWVAVVKSKLVGNGLEFDLFYTILQNKRMQQCRVPPPPPPHQQFSNDLSYPNKLYIVGKRIYRRVRIIKNIGKIFWFRDFMSNFREIGGI